MDAAPREITLAWKYLPPFMLGLLWKEKIYSQSSSQFWKDSDTVELNSYLPKLFPFEKWRQILRCILSP